LVQSARRHFLTDYWARGFATEIASALFGNGMNASGPIEHCGLRGSRELSFAAGIEKVGFSFEQMLDYDGESCVLYRIHCPPMLSNEHRAPRVLARVRKA
jgi:hypothetical protein